MEVKSCIYRLTKKHELHISATGIDKTAPLPKHIRRRWSSLIY